MAFENNYRVAFFGAKEEVINITQDKQENEIVDINSTSDLKKESKKID